MTFQTFPAPATSRCEAAAPRARALIAVAAATALLAVVLVIAARSAGVAPHRLLQDPAAQYGFPPFVGLISHAGVALLVATAAILAFAAVVGRRDAALLWAVAALSSLLAADDLLMLHERVFPRLLGLTERLPYAAYAALGTLILARLPRDRRSLGLLVPLSLLGVSMGADLASDVLGVPFQRVIVVEDTAKVAGYAAWLAFWAGLAGGRLREEMTAGGGAWPTRSS